MVAALATLLLALLALAPGRASALSLGEGLAILERSGREAAVAAALEQVQQSAVALADAARRPSVDAYARETLLALQPGVVAGAQTLDTAERDSFSYGVRARQVLSDFGRTDAAVRAAALELEAGRLDTRLSRNRAALRFIQAYLRLLRAERQLALQRQEVARFETHRADTRALLEAGTVTENDLLQTEVRLSDAEQRRLQAENLRELAASQVNSLLLRPLAAPVAAEEVTPPQEGSGALAEALAAAERDRLEVREAQARLLAAEARRDVVRAEHRPQLYLAGSYDFTQNRYQVHEGNWSVLAGLEVNLYSGGLSAERLRQRERELRVQAQGRELLLDAVRLEVREALLALQTARARAAASEKAVEQAQENLRIERSRYAEGVGTATEVLDAVSLLSTAEQNRFNAGYDAAEAQARLDFATGRDLALAWGGAPAPTTEGSHE